MRPAQKRNGQTGFCPIQARICPSIAPSAPKESPLAAVLKFAVGLWPLTAKRETGTSLVSLRLCRTNLPVVVSRTPILAV